MLIGGGLRFKVINNKKVTSRIGTSIFYEYEKYEVDKSSLHSETTELFRFSSYITFLICLNDNFSILSTTYLQPAINNLNDFRVLSDNGLNFRLGKNIDLTITINLMYDSEPADGVENFDLINKLGISFNFE